MIFFLTSIQLFNVYNDTKVVSKKNFFDIHT
jgi:hypothetical protein